MQNQAHEDLRYHLALALAPKIGPGVFKAIVAYSGSAVHFFKLPKGKVAKTPKVGDKLLSLRNQENELLRAADGLINECEKKHYQILTPLHPDFPHRFKMQEDSPVVIFAQGNSKLNFDRTVGIVGTRSATSYGKSATRKIIEDLLVYQPAIISGLAYGIDIEAHRAALAVGLPTIAVLGSPIGHIYPAVHKKTAEAIMESGALLSEYAPGSPMVPGNFPARNRIIASLSDALIVVEAAEKGGALITAEIAYSYDKDVFAVPGNLQSQYSEGCNLLIKKMKANIYTGPNDVAEALFWSKPGEIKMQKPKIDLTNRDDEEQQILKLLMDNGEMEIDSLSLTTEIPLGLLSSKLLSLEFEGIVKSLPGKKYRILI
ncbi:DNA-processing protein DprA [Algoriphagus persicinus]|uniref:DNA-processing protein DprA n=1 Tax=Algoriphagus persicinus TaxID=3108754 RepID=UPI002B398ABE|nr:MULTISPECIES: DNA-processing protein DprA [unclassified Algoriphagus]MEB2780588.1 DNA-processing protein DprA [Algoriphagus sp. C2-6-M1]MEB2785883.1 DNA-processing protein DprA [Algoriphagus sp. E1-3-M2]